LVELPSCPNSCFRSESGESSNLYLSHSSSRSSGDRSHSLLFVRSDVTTTDRGGHRRPTLLVSRALSRNCRMRSHWVPSAAYTESNGLLLTAVQPAYSVVSDLPGGILSGVGTPDSEPRYSSSVPIEHVLPGKQSVLTVVNAAAPFTGSPAPK